MFLYTLKPEKLEKQRSSASDWNAYTLSWVIC